MSFRFPALSKIQSLSNSCWSRQRLGDPGDLVGLYTYKNTHTQTHTHTTVLDRNALRKICLEGKLDGTGELGRVEEL